MPKQSKSKRKKLKAEAERKAASRAKRGKPYSRHKEYVCYHHLKSYEFVRNEFIRTYIRNSLVIK